MVDIKTELSQLRLRLIPSRFKKDMINKYARLHGRVPNIETPTLFTEKVLSRILGPLDPFYGVIGKKHLAPIYVLATLGPGIIKIAERYLVTRNLHQDHLSNLPNRFVVKSSFGSGVNEIVLDKAICDWGAICVKFNRALATATNSQGLIDRENCIIIEEFIGETDTIPADYRVHCFQGSDETFDFLIQVDSGRHSDLRVSLFDNEKNWLHYGFNGRKRHDEAPILPSLIDDVVQHAKALSNGFDYLRVDFYIINDEIYFGELTPFPMGGAAKFTDSEADKFYGDKWEQRDPMYDGTSYMSRLFRTD